MKRNYTIDLIKIFMAVSIAFGHYKAQATIISSDIAVGCFFVISGFFMVNSFHSPKYNRSPWRYTQNRFCKIYPYYLTAFLLLFLSDNWNKGISTLYYQFIELLPEVLLVQNIGIYANSINYPLWQLCTLFVASFLLFAMLDKDEKFTLNVVCPVIALLVYTYLANAYGSHKVKLWGIEFQFFYIPMLRAAAGLSLGMFLNKPIRWALSVLEANRCRFDEICITLGGIVCILMFWARRYDHIAYLPFTGILICCMYWGERISRMFRCRIFDSMEKLSLSIYLNHVLAIHIFRRFASYTEKLSKGVQLTLLLFLILLISVSMIFLTDLIMKVLGNIIRKFRKPAEA